MVRLIIANNRVVGCVDARGPFLVCHLFCNLARRPNPCKGLAGNEVSCQHHCVPLAIRNTVSCWYYCWLLVMQLVVGINTRWLAIERYLLLATDLTWVGFNPRVLGWAGFGLGWVTIYADPKPIWVGWPRPKASPTRPMSRPIRAC